ncbi:acylphosphatase-2 isoform X4 [Gopherus flavomarginatus]|uniref:acylphosphatase-2 isoform X3 n=1 Tax=Gopherus evgoodei TaxID=1825980 RepID=UPI0011CFB91E|nr:acylphosphatase-2 isoform X3 [Gopherus evgoodei]XP_050807928.1 acylphosphatase-2 isoform X4 [Gopherus flavomarginatus]
MSIFCVCFRMYTEDEARKMGVVGWVKNTRQGTVTGQVQGPEDKVNAMKAWLSKVGSPSSRIDRTNFFNEKEISKLDFSGFSTRY